MQLSYSVSDAKAVQCCQISNGGSFGVLRDKNVAGAQRRGITGNNV